MPDYGIWTGAERATGRIAETGMGLLNWKTNQENTIAMQEIQKDKLAIAQAEEMRKKQDWQKKQSAYDRPMDIKTHPIFLSLPESAQQKALKYFSSNGYTNAEGIGKTGDIEQGTTILEKSKTIFGDIMGDVVKAKYEGVIEAWNKFKTVQVKGDKEKTAQAKAEFDRLNAEYQASAGNFTKHIETLTAQESKEELERMKLAQTKETGDVVQFEQENPRFKGVDRSLQSYQTAIMDWRTAKHQATAPTSDITDYKVFYSSQKALKKTDAEIDAAWHKRKLEEQAEAGKARAREYKDAMPVTMLDTHNNNEMVTLPFGEVREANALTPGRYLDSSKAQKALTQKALIEDIHGAIRNAQGSVTRLKTNFDEKSRLILYRAVHASNPTGMINNLIGGEFGKALTPDQIDYLTDLNQVIENSMAMRSVLGAGQGSDQLRDAIKQTVPSEGSFSKEYALSQLKKFEMQVTRLERGIPGVKLAKPAGEIETGGKPNTTGTVIRYNAQGQRIQ